VRVQERPSFSRRSGSWEEDESKGLTDEREDGGYARPRRRGLLAPFETSGGVAVRASRYRRETVETIAVQATSASGRRKLKETTERGISGLLGRRGAPRRHDRSFRFEVVAELGRKSKIPVVEAGMDVERKGGSLAADTTAFVLFVCCNVFAACLLQRLEASSYRGIMLPFVQE
jgi:hypothetical protein